MPARANNHHTRNISRAILCCAGSRSRSPLRWRFAANALCCLPLSRSLSRGPPSSSGGQR
ncbi:hypothetical protein BDA96_09G164600 [Sorghum bicolor]|uniref:Uncharacterized protein n=1 Tax=Sorghum bicolor TaxID=4558 RepID=A0A921U5A1_SORBI|nr:hypothetical protein BDA96_09G164600 [Sorghum bicolor]